MTFVLSKSVTIKWPVTVEIPADGGKLDKQTFEVEFKKLSKSELEKFFEGSREDGATDVTLCCDIMVGWSGVSEADGSHIPFSKEAVARVLDAEPKIGAAIIGAFLESRTGSRIKN